MADVARFERTLMRRAEGGGLGPARQRRTELLAGHHADRISDHIFAEEHERIRRQCAAADDVLQRYQLDPRSELEFAWRSR
jgi:hypothetical protein